MSDVTTVDARRDFSDLLNRVAYGHERMVLTRRGKRLVAVVPVEDLELLESLEDRIDLEAAREALAEADREGTTSWEGLKTELGL